MSILGETGRRIPLKTLASIQQDAPSIADTIGASMDKGIARSEEIFTLLAGRANQQQCASLAELERLGVIIDIRADGTVAAGPNLENYKANRSL